jgi:hypothetical protein
MSLNRFEQQVLDYIQRNPEERHYWEQKVRAVAAAEGDVHAASLALDAGLWDYVQERARVVAEFREYGPPPGRAVAKRISLRNLAEYWLRMWAPPKRIKPRENRQEV